MQKTVQMVVVLGVICLVSAASLATVFRITDPIIKKRRMEDIRKMAASVLPGAKFELPQADTGEMPDRFEGLGPDGKPMGVVYVSKARGYGGIIDVVVGLDKTGRITGVEIGEQRETPGLGSKVTEPDFLKQFRESNASDFKTGKFKLDAVTGATISSRAVEKAVRAAAERLMQESFYSPVSSSGSSGG